jgi:hypothetical protein
MSFGPYVLNSTIGRHNGTTDRLAINCIGRADTIGHSVSSAHMIASGIHLHRPIRLHQAFSTFSDRCIRRTTDRPTGPPQAFIFVGRADDIGHSVCSAHMMASVLLAELIASGIHLRRPIRLHQYMIRSIVLMLSYGPMQMNT